MGNNEVKENIRDYIFGGRSEFTLVQEGRAEVKYKVTSNDNGSCYFVRTERNNSREVIYQGYIKTRDMSFHEGRNIEDFNETAIKALMWVINHSERLPSIVHIYHNGRCAKCGRKLTDAESLRAGLGPTCRKKS